MEVFREPVCRWCAGKRGIEYQISAPTVVRSGGSGVVSFSGRVGGVNYLVVRSASGIAVTYGRMTRAYVYMDDVVGVGEPLGEISAPEARLYFGVRISGRYVDPLLCLANPGGGQRHAILIPNPTSPASR